MLRLKHLLLGQVLLVPTQFLLLRAARPSPPQVCMYHVWVIRPDTQFRLGQHNHHRREDYVLMPVRPFRVDGRPEIPPPLLLRMN